MVHKVTEYIDHGLTEGLDPAELILKSADWYREEFRQEVDSSTTDDFQPQHFRAYGRPTAEKPNGEDGKWWADVGIPNSLRAYLRWRRSNPEFTILDIDGFGSAIEVPFEVEFGGSGPVRGVVDRVFRFAGSPVVCDLKSGAKPKSTEQLGLYARAVEIAYGIKITHGFYLYNLKHGVAKTTTIANLDQWTNAGFEDAYTKANKIIENNLYTPNVDSHCWTICSVRHRCEYAPEAL